MSEAASLNTDAELQTVAWDLSDLTAGYGAPDRAAADAMLAAADVKTAAFAEAYAGRVGELNSRGLVSAMLDLAKITDLLTRLGSFVGLHFSTNTADPERGALMQYVQEQATQLQTRLLFFELEWAELEDHKVGRLLSNADLDFCRHHLESARRYRPHLLSEPEEKILAEKSVVARSAWDRLFEENTSSITVDLGEDEPVALEMALSRLASPDREVRKKAAEGVTAALTPDLRTRAFAFNTLLADKMIDDRLRKFPSWISSRNLDNETSDESVEALITAVQARSELPRRWYRLKAQMLGLERLADYDRMAPLTDDEATFTWSEAREIVLEAYQAFSPKTGEAARRFFDNNWIDAPVRSGKRGGAFCAYTSPSVHPYLMLNYTSKRRDVLTLAHEMGHGIHAAFGGKQGIFHMSTPLTLAETASVFGETLVFQSLLERAESPEARLSLFAESLEGSIATVFRQIAMNRFENNAHTERREQGELSVERINELWANSQTDLLGDAVEITDGYRCWWSYVSHFISVPGYVYAYAYGQLFALAIYARYEKLGKAFVPDYLELLEAGGSKSPEELGKIVGIDVADPGFWDAGLDLVERQLTQAEEAASAVSNG